MVIRKWSNGVSLSSTDLGLSLDNLNSGTLVSDDPELYQVWLYFVAADAGSDADGTSKRLTLNDLRLLEDHEGFDWSLPASDLAVYIDLIGFPGDSEARFALQWWRAGRQVQAIGHGIVVNRDGVLARIPAEMAEILAAMRAFNKADGQAKTYELCFTLLQQAQAYAESHVQMQLKGIVKTQVIVRPQSFKIGVRQELDEKGEPTVFGYPIIAGVPEDKLADAFLKQHSDVPSVISLQNPTHDTRVLIDETLKSTMQAFKQSTFGMRGPRIAKFLKNPLSILPEGSGIDLDRIDLYGFSERVIGLGYLGNVGRNEASDIQWFDDTPPPQTANVRVMTEAGTECSLGLKAAQVDVLLERIDASAGLTIDFDNQVLINDSRLKESLLAAKASFYQPGENLDQNEPTTKQGESSGFRNILVKSNDQELEFISIPQEREDYDRDQSLELTYLKPNLIKDYQIEGVRWLQELSAQFVGTGGILADDMGLGKTLQILAFLSWYVSLKTSNKEALNNKPILILVPPILLGNWEKEIAEFFVGSPFLPIDFLTSDKINRKYKIMDDRELKVEKPTLDLDKLSSLRMLVLSYDALKNFQHSFASINWSVVVADEAQRIKEVNSGITHAVKALKADFKVASTGTPIENSIADLWSLIDFIRAGHMMGSRSDFLAKYSSVDDDQSALGQNLMREIGFNRPGGSILRRTKKEKLADQLKPKMIKEIACPLSAEQIRLYKEIVASVGAKRMKPLPALNMLAQLMQHPALADQALLNSHVDRLIDLAPKLDVLLRELKLIRQAGEKALIFTRSIGMQGILKTVIDDKLSLDCDIINGATGANRKNMQEERFNRVTTFCESKGFNVLILGPDVAATGLNIVAANHVIHYGRWWNPAKEAQSTDRAYRLKQTRPVTVYYLIGEDPAGKCLFDRQLNSHLKSKMAVAENFLSAVPSENAVASELGADVFGRGRQDLDEPIRSLYDLDPDAFEAWAACLYQARGYEVVLTPVIGDRGVDVLAYKDGQVTLIQVKLRTQPGDAPRSGVTEVASGLDFYRHHLLKRASESLRFRMLYLSNGRIDERLGGFAFHNQVDLEAGEKIEALREQYPISFGELQNMESQRSKDCLEACFKLTAVISPSAKT